MSKHQSCRECRRDFVGPDLEIGSNLCPECEAELHGDCLDRIAELEAEVKRLKEHLNHAARMDRKRNIEVLAVLGETSPTNPEEHYIPSVTLAKRVQRAEAEVQRLKGEEEEASADE